MRSFLIKDDDVVAVEELPNVAESEAIELARKKFQTRKWEFDGFEVWNDARLLYEFPEPLNAAVQSSRS